MPDPRTIEPQPEPEPDGTSRKARPQRRRSSVAQTMGGVLFGFEQQVWRTAPPPQELVHHARPDAPVPAADGTMLTIELPQGADDDEEPRPGPQPSDGAVPSQPRR